LPALFQADKSPPSKHEERRMRARNRERERRTPDE
jgi:hypothetical protein